MEINARIIEIPRRILIIKYESRGRVYVGKLKNSGLGKGWETGESSKQRGGASALFAIDRINRFVN